VLCQGALEVHAPARTLQLVHVRPFLALFTEVRTGTLAAHAPCGVEDAALHTQAHEGLNSAHKRGSRMECRAGIKVKQVFTLVASWQAEENWSFFVGTVPDMPKTAASDEK